MSIVVEGLEQELADVFGTHQWRDFCRKHAMNRINKKGMLVCMLLFCLLSSKAQQDLCDTSSCQYGRMGNYKIEMEKRCGDMLTVYIHASNDQSLQGKGILGYVDYFYPNNVYFVEDLYHYRGTNKLEAPIPTPGYFSAKVTLVIDTETVSAFFNNECVLRASDASCTTSR